MLLKGIFSGYLLVVNVFFVGGFGFCWVIGGVCLGTVMLLGF